MKNEQGFTLVEIMIVVVIVGLLATMAVPAWQKSRLRTQNETILNNLRQINTAAQQYFLETGDFSVALTDLVGTGTDKYVKPIKIVRGEAYPATILVSDTQITATSSVANISYPP